jgi:hypothetical protein
MTRGGSGSDHGHVVEDVLLKFQKKRSVPR